MQGSPNLSSLFRRPESAASSSASTPAATQAQLPGAAAVDNASLLDLIDRRYKWSRDRKTEMLETWATCLAFYVGDQWRTWDQRKRQLVKRTQLPAHRILSTYNQIPGVIDTAASKLGKSRQLPQARPDDETDPEDCARARLATHALKGWWYKESFDLAEHELNVNRILFGAAFVHLYWDPHRLAKVPVPDPYSGRSKPQYAPVGDLSAEVITVFDVFPEPTERWEDCHYVIVARRKPLWWFKETFPEAGQQVVPDHGDVDSAFTSLLPGVEMLGGLQDSTAAPNDDGMATLKVYYEKPSQRFPQGRTAYSAGKVLLFQQERLPLPFQGVANPLPVKMLSYRYVPKRLWPKGLIEECLSPQREINRGLGNMAELIRLYRGPKWFVHKGAKLKPNAITSAPDEVVEWDGQIQPVAVPPPGVQGWIAEYAASQREELRAVAGQHEVSEGQVPNGVQAASAIALLQQSDNSRLSAPTLLGKLGLEDLFKHALTVMAERYREPRTLTVPGRAGQQTSAAVTGQEIGPLEVEVQIQDGIEDNDAVRTQQVTDWLGAGLFMQPLPFVLNILRDVGQTWLAEAIEEAQPQVEAQQQQQAQQQMQMQQQQAAMQGGPSGPDPAAQLALQQQQQSADAQSQATDQQGQLIQSALQQQGQAQQQAADHAHQLTLAQIEAERERLALAAKQGHELRLAMLKGQQQMDTARLAAKNRPKPAPGAGKRR